jgi:hypothetical protein
MSRISMIMIPALEEITSYEGDDSYYCGLDLTRDSIDSLIDHIASAFHRSAASDRPSWPALSIVRPKRPQLHPELFFQIATTISVGTISIYFYKLLKLWVSSRNGRKIRVKLPNGFQIETTQLTYRQFCKLFSELHKYESSKVNSKVLLKTLRSQGYTFVTEEELDDEGREL